MVTFPRTFVIRFGIKTSCSEIELMKQNQSRDIDRIQTTIQLLHNKMYWWFAIIGIFILTWAWYEVISTILSASGDGLLTDFSCDLIHYIALKISRLLPTRTGRSFLRLSGPYSLIYVIIMWTALSWVGWAFIYLAISDKIINSDTSETASIYSIIYFSGMLLPGTGLGDYIPNNPSAQICTAVTAISGIIFVTLVVSFLAEVLSNFMEMKQLAASIHVLGKTPQEILVNFWNGKDFGSLEDTISEIATDIAKAAQIQRTFPIILHYHSASRSNSVTLQIGVFSELLVLVRCAISPELQPSKAVLNKAERSIDIFLKSIRKSHSFLPMDYRETPSIPPFNDLFQAAIPIAETEYKHKVMENGISKRRREVAIFLTQSGWEWDNIHLHAKKSVIHLFKIGHKTPSYGTLER